MTSSWFFLSTLNYDARSTTHQIYSTFLHSRTAKQYADEVNEVAQIRVILKLIYILPSYLCRREQYRVNAIGYTHELVFRRFMAHILDGLSSISTAGYQCVLPVFEDKFPGSTSNYVTTSSCASWFMKYSARRCTPYAALRKALNLLEPELFFLILAHPVHKM